MAEPRPIRDAAGSDDGVEGVPRADALDLQGEAVRAVVHEEVHRPAACGERAVHASSAVHHALEEGAQREVRDGLGIALREGRQHVRVLAAPLAEGGEEGGEVEASVRGGPGTPRDREVGLHIQGERARQDFAVERVRGLRSARGALHEAEIDDVLEVVGIQ